MKIFFDCGTHYFEGFKKFKEKLNIDNSWKIFCFEANPYTYKNSLNILGEFNNLDITYFNKAVHIEDSRIKMNCALEGNNPVSQASNILDVPPSVDIVYGGRHSYIFTEVDTIDFRKFILNNSKIDDEIYIKMDIEGAEFEVLNNIIINNDINNIKEIYIEFHERFFLNDIQQKIVDKKNILQYFKNKNIIAEEWE